MKRFALSVLGFTLVVFTLAGFAYGGHGQLNINTATAEELQLLPRIGESIAQNIVEFRKANGPFTTLDDLTKVKGIGESRLDQIRNFLKLEGISDYKPTESTLKKGHSPQKSSD
jgi:competence ComEA-like helix-hairpin-helix protein